MTYKKTSLPSDHRNFQGFFYLLLAHRERAIPLNGTELVSPAARELSTSEVEVEANPVFNELCLCGGD